jgi:hypothetical protein
MLKTLVLNLPHPTVAMFSLQNVHSDVHKFKTNVNAIGFDILWNTIKTNFLEIHMRIHN